MSNSLIAMVVSIVIVLALAHFTDVWLVIGDISPGLGFITGLGLYAIVFLIVVLSTDA